MKTKEEIEANLKEFEDKKSYAEGLIKQRDPRMNNYLHALPFVEMRIQTLKWVLEEPKK